MGLQVAQLTWDGELLPVCALGGGPPAVLAGAAADRLIVARGGVAGSGVCDFSSRALSLLPALLHGWASLAALDVLPGMQTCQPQYGVIHAYMLKHRRCRLQAIHMTRRELSLVDIIKYTTKHDHGKLPSLRAKRYAYEADDTRPLAKPVWTAFPTSVEM